MLIGDQSCERGVMRCGLGYRKAIFASHAHLFHFISLHFAERVRLLSQGVVKKLNAGAEVEYISVIKA